MQNYLTLEEVSNRLHITAGTARNRIYKGEPMPPSLRVGRRRLFPEIDFEAWLRQFLESEIAACNRDRSSHGARQK